MCTNCMSGNLATKHAEELQTAKGLTRRAFFFPHIQKFFFPIAKSTINSPPRPLLDKPLNSFSPHPHEVSSPTYAPLELQRERCVSGCRIGAGLRQQEEKAVARPARLGEAAHRGADQLSEARRRQLARRSRSARVCHPSCRASCRGSAPGAWVLSSPAAREEGIAAKTIPPAQHLVLGYGCSLHSAGTLVK